MVAAKANTRKAISAKPTRQLVTFMVDRYLFGIDVTNVQEVLRHQDTTNVPLAPEVVKGLINLRGQIIPAIDVRCRLGLPEKSSGTEPMNVVTRVDGEVISFLVDEIGDVIDVCVEQCETTPTTISRDWADVIEGVYKLEGRLILTLNPERAAAIAN